MGVGTDAVVTSPLAGKAARRYKAPRARPIEVVATPFTGMRDSLDPASTIEGGAALLQNVYPLPTGAGIAVVGRPGFQAMGTTLPGIVQGFHQFTKLDGTERTIAIANGQCFTFDWVARTWTEVLTGADLSSAGITLSTTARCAFVTFTDRVVVSDGVNTPWMWDGTTGSGLTLLTNCPVLYGPPTVYYAKLFGIRADDRTTMVWSEENDATTGYEAGGFVNAWTLGQSDQEALVALHGTNDALYYFRERSAGTVAGAVNDTFVTSGVHDTFDVGTRSPWAILRHEGVLLFPDADGRPHQLTTGARPEPVWGDLAETLKSIPRSGLVSAMAVDYTPADLRLIGLQESGQDHVSAWLAYRQGRVMGVWRGFTATASAMVKDGSGVPTWVHGTSAGQCYDHGNPEGSLWNDDDQPIRHVVESQTMGYDLRREVTWDRLDLATRAESPMTLAVSLLTPHGTSTTQAVSLSGGVMYWDIGEWDTGAWVGTSLEATATLGWATTGRWARVSVRHETLGERFGLTMLRLVGTYLHAEPSAP